MQHFQRQQPFGKITPRQILTLPLEHIHPVVRIAHMVTETLGIAERIIFDYEFVWIQRGQLTIVTSDKSYSCVTNDLLFIPPFIPHTFPLIDGDENEHVAIHFDFAPNVPPSSNDVDERAPYEVRFPYSFQIPLQMSFANNHRVERLLKDLLAARATNTALAELSVVHLMTGILLECLQYSSRSELPQDAVQVRNQTRVERVIQFIETHLAQEISVDTLVEVSEISSSRLQTVFRETTGYALLDYLRRRRIEEARTLLANPNIAIKEIAVRTGFEDSYHFSKVFRRIDGLSPSQYRNAVLANRPQDAAQKEEKL